MFEFVADIAADGLLELIGSLFCAIASEFSWTSPPSGVIFPALKQ